MGNGNQLQDLCSKGDLAYFAVRICAANSWSRCLLARHCDLADVLKSACIAVTPVARTINKEGLEYEDLENDSDGGAAYLRCD